MKHPIRVWTGPVHSGKTKRAMTRAIRLTRLGHHVVAVRPARARRDHEPEGWIITQDEVPCETCRGDGKVERGREMVACPGCDETGRVNSQERWPCLDVESVEHMTWLAHEAASSMTPTTLWIEEAMLFRPDQDGLLFPAVQELRETMPVNVTGLTQTSECEPFGLAMPSIVSIADRVYVCLADCDNCGSMDSATRSWHRQGKTSQVAVGGVSEYWAVCPSCHNQLSASRYGGV